MIKKAFAIGHLDRIIYKSKNLSTIEREKYAT